MISLHQTTLDGIANAENLLAEYERIDLIVASSEDAAKSAAAAWSAAADALAKMECDSLLLINDKEARAAEKKIEQLAKVAADAQAAANRARRIANALAAKRDEAAAAIEAERPVMRSVVSQHEEDVTVGYTVDLIAAAGPLIEALRRGNVLRNATHSRALAQALGEAVLPNPSLFNSPIVSGDRVTVDGRVISILEGYEKDERLMFEAELASRPRLTLAKLDTFSTKAERDRQAELRRPRSTGYSTHGRGGAAQPVAQPSARAEITATPRMGSGPVLDANMGAHLLDDPDLAFHR